MTTNKRVIGWGIAIMLLLPIVGGLYSVFSSVVTAPSRVINETMKTQNIIHSYEWFYDVNAAYNARLSQVRQYQGFVQSETDSDERRMLRTELSAMQQTCRTLVEKYNANSQKMNKSIFKGWSLPVKLPLQSCS